MYTFDYQRPGSSAAAASAFSGDARYLAGGQSLVQAMKLRLSQSERLIDLGGIADLKTIRVDGGNVIVGAMATHASVERSAIRTSWKWANGSWPWAIPLACPTPLRSGGGTRRGPPSMSPRR